ncbi:MAG: DNA repair protein RadA [Bacillota bacterium]|nr:DNA repair protein RadA [Bacillota bacterium]
MPRQKTVFMCGECGYESPKWMGKCPGCMQWNTMTEVAQKSNLLSSIAKLTGEPLSLDKIIEEETPRVPTGISELDRVLGGGAVRGSVILTGGEPGIGKSTLMLQASGKLCENGSRVLYVTGEESAKQVKMRASRLNISHGNLFVLAETDVNEILSKVADIKADFLMVDSIQTIYDPDFDCSPGSVSQVRECAAKLLYYAKSTSVTVFIVGHVTKEGAIAGPRIMEHMVDTVLYFEGENFNAFRILRAVKNRFGSTNEIGVFEMRQEGMAEVLNPSAMLLSSRVQGVAGSAVACCMEGTRPVLAEVQALVSPASFGVPRRMASGVDYNRLAMLAAVLEKRVGLNLSNQDIYINVVGGIRLEEPAYDLALACAIASSFKNIPVFPDTAIIGEVGLTGEVRDVGQMEKRLAECAKLGFARCIVPRGTSLKSSGITLSRVADVKAALEEALI